MKYAVRFDMISGARNGYGGSRDDDTYDPHESTKKFGGVSDLFTS